MRTRQDQNFLNSLPIVAGCLGNKLGVMVRLGKQACTNGAIITIPADTSDKISREELLGFVVHEASHIRYTDFSCIGETPLERMLTNALEDSRIERLIGQEYAGAKFLLKRMNEPMLEELSQKQKITPGAALGLYAALKTQATFVPEYSGYRDTFRKKAVGNFGEELINKVDMELSNFPQFSGTKDCLGAAKRIISLLQDVSQDKQKEQSSGCSDSANSDSDSESSDQSGGGESHFDGSDQGKDASSDSSESNGISQNSDAQAENAPSEGASSENAPSEGASSGGRGADNTSAQDGDCNLTERQKRAIRKALASAKLPSASEQVAKKINADVGANSKSSNIGESMAVRPPKKYRPGNQTEVNNDSPSSPEELVAVGRERLALAKRLTPKLRKALIGLVQAKTMDGIRTANSGRRIQTGQLCRLAMGSTRIFEKRDENVSVDTSVTILLDLSGSMGVCAADNAIVSALGLMTALGGIPKVKSALTVFPARAVGKGGTCRKLIDYGERIEKHLRVIGKMEAWGNTPLAETLLETSVELSSRREARKIVIVVTDGCVSDDANDFVRKLSASGIVMVGVGLGEVGVEEFFPHHVTINSSEELPSELLKIARKVLVH